jgi:hypothetical protein
MISDKGLLFIEPEEPASVAPLIDHFTRQMTAAYRAAEPSTKRPSRRGRHGGFPWHTILAAGPTSKRRRPEAE